MANVIIAIFILFIMKIFYKSNGCLSNSFMDIDTCFY